MFDFKAINGTMREFLKNNHYYYKMLLIKRSYSFVARKIYIMKVFVCKIKYSEDRRN